MERFYPTSVGREYAAQTAMGKVLKFTRGKFGDGVRTNQNISAMKDLINPLGDLLISKKSIKGSTITVTTQFSNMVDGNLLSTFNLSEAGLFGKLVDADGTDIPEYPEALLGYVFDNPGDKIPEVLTEFILNFPLTVSDAENVTIEVSSMAYARQIDLNTLNQNINDETQKRICEDYYAEYTSDAVDENTEFYIDVANIDGDGATPFNAPARDITSWRDLVSDMPFAIDRKNIKSDGIESLGTAIRGVHTDYLGFNSNRSFTILFAAKLTETEETVEIFSFGSSCKLAIEQCGTSGLRLVAYDDTGTVRYYPSDTDEYVVPNGYGEYHHYAVVFNNTTNRVMWYQDGKLVSTATTTIENDFVKIDGGYDMSLLGPNDMGLRYLKIQGATMKTARVRDFCNARKDIDYQKNVTKIDNKLRSVINDIGNIKIPKAATVVVGTTKSGHTQNDCDFLCNGMADDVEIQAAINACTNGGKVLILEGTYNLASNIVSYVNYMTLAGSGQSTILRKSNDSANGGAFICLYGSYCAIQDLCVDGNSYECCGAQIGNYGFIRNITCKNNKGSGIHCAGDSIIIGNTVELNEIGISVHATENVRIIGNTIRNNSVKGINVQSCSDIIISANMIDNNNCGLYVTTYPENNQRFTITGNTFASNNSAALEASRLENSTISGNTCTDNAGGIHLHLCLNVTVSGNTCIGGYNSIAVYNEDASGNAHDGYNLIVGNNIMGNDYNSQDSTSTFVNNKYQ